MAARCPDISSHLISALLFPLSPRSLPVPKNRLIYAGRHPDKHAEEIGKAAMSGKSRLKRGLHRSQPPVPEVF